MQDSVMTIIAIFLAAVLMFVFPLLSVSERQEEVTQLAVQTTTSEFVDKISTSGLLKQTDYDEFVQKLGATGNTYDIEIEIQHLDENIGKKSVSSSGSLIGENVRYSTFTSSILESEAYRNGAYPLKKGDIVIVTAKNNNTTLAQLLRTVFYSVTNNGSYQVGASYSSMVVNNGKI